MNESRQISRPDEEYYCARPECRHPLAEKATIDISHPLGKDGNPQVFCPSETGGNGCYEAARMGNFYLTPLGKTTIPIENVAGVVDNFREQQKQRQRSRSMVPY